MNEWTKIYVLIGCLFLVVFIGIFGLVRMLRPAIEELEKRGIKSVVESMWCGEEGCKP